MINFEELQNKISKKFSLEILIDILKKASNSSDVKLTNIIYGESTKKGDSYLSNITRLSVEYTATNSGKSHNKVLHIICKSLLKNVARRKTFRAYDFFANEINFYEKVWPQLDAYQKSKGAKDLFTEVPNFLYGYIDGTNDYILMEDLCFEGFRIPDRSVELDLLNAKLVLKIFARFHALSMAYKRDNPEKFQSSMVNILKETYFHENFRNWYSNFQNNQKTVTLDTVEQELPKHYLERLKKIYEGDIFGKTCQLCAEQGEFSAICHGDAWLPNFLMKFDENESPIRTAMIDFQLARCASLSQDLMFFIYSCTNESLRIQHFDELLIFYCEEFQKFFNQFHDGLILNYRILREEFKKNGIFALCMGMEAVIMSVMDDNEVSDLDEIEGEEAVPLETVWKVYPLKTKEKRQRLASVVKHMMDNGFI